MQICSCENCADKRKKDMIQSGANTPNVHLPVLDKYNEHCKLLGLRHLPEHTVFPIQNVQ